MLTFASICPHPPIIIPGVGQSSDFEKVQATAAAMKELAEELEMAAVDTIVVISPHALLEYDSFVINSNEILAGSLNQFGAGDSLSFANDLDLVENIRTRAVRRRISVRLHPHALDHGAFVPLFYLTKNIKPQLVHLSFSMNSLMTHFEYGKVIGDAIRAHGKKAAIVASGDLSHRVTPDAPAGFSPHGKEFDEKIVNLLEEAKYEKVVNIEAELIEEAGECGLRSIVILLGALDGVKHEFKKLNYEAPFGVGYLVGKVKIEN